MAKEYLIVVTPANDGELTEEHLELLSMDGWDLVSVHESREYDENKYYFKRDVLGCHLYDKKIWKKIFKEYISGLVPLEEALKQLECLTEKVFSTNEEE